MVFGLLFVFIEEGKVDLLFLLVVPLEIYFLKLSNFFWNLLIRNLLYFILNVAVFVLMEYLVMIML